MPRRLERPDGRTELHPHFCVTDRDAQRLVGQRHQLSRQGPVRGGNRAVPLRGRVDQRCVERPVHPRPVHRRVESIEPFAMHPRRVGDAYRDSAHRPRHRTTSRPSSEPSTMPATRSLSELGAIPRITPATRCRQPARRAAAPVHATSPGRDSRCRPVRGPGRERATRRLRLGTPPRCPTSRVRLTAVRLRHARPGDWYYFVEQPEHGLFDHRPRFVGHVTASPWAAREGGRR